MSVNRKPLIYKRSRELVYKGLGIPTRMDPDFAMFPKKAVVGLLHKWSGSTAVPVEAMVYVVTRQEADPTFSEHPHVSGVVRKGARSHRVWCICPECHKHIPLSRIHQHYGSSTCKPGLGEAILARREELRKEVA